MNPALKSCAMHWFWPALFQGNVSDSEKKLFSLPASHGGLRIQDPLSTAVSSFATSRKCTACIVDAIKCNSFFSVFNHIDHLSKLHRELNHDIEIQYQNLLNSVFQTFDNKKRAIQRGIDGKTSAWLTVIPKAYHHFDLSTTEFRDSLREPVVREPNDREKVPALVADLSVCGVWHPQATTFFDVQVVDSDANSYLHHDVGAVLSSIEHTKKQ